MSLQKARVLLVAGLSLLVVGGAFAWARGPQTVAPGGAAARRPEVKVLLQGAVERAGASVAVEQAGLVNPGEIVNWTITSRNQGGAAANDYKTVGRVPPGTAFVAGSASADEGAAILYSIDGGQTFSAQPVVEARQPDGTMKRTPAPTAMYTHVRYEWKAALAAGEQVAARYKVRVK